MCVMHMCVSAVNERVWRSRNSLLFFLLQSATSGGLVVACAYIGWASPYVKDFDPPSPPPGAAMPNAAPNML